jgi:predicted metalloprotease with PDZ domain
MKSDIKGISRVFMTAAVFILTMHALVASGSEKDKKPIIQYSVSMADPSSHFFHVVLDCSGFKGDTIDFMMPRWMPGYYQMMEYPDGVKNFSANNSNGRNIPVIKANSFTWKVVPGKSTSFSIIYDVYSSRNFVATNYLDSTHGYIIPAATFIYPSGHLDLPVSVKIVPFKQWKNIATGLVRIEGSADEFTAPDFDNLYDCPILIGNLEELPSFKINGIVHRFIAFNPGTFNRELFMSSLEKAVKSGIDLIGDIPYKEYTFIGIGKGYGGIEHLNNTTVSFSGTGLEKPGALVRTLKFLTHEYFHHFNVKRIRPYELGPFDYERENRTNLLWVSEGLSVYYEYLIIKRAGLMSEFELLKSLEDNINTIENDPGRKYQSLSQSSYETWDDGPFGNKPGSEDKSISYYDKGPIIGLILDFAIRKGSGNAKSLDDVMRYLYGHYYKTLRRGFTDAEFQQACEDIAGISLSREFEYVYTTKEIDYSTYLTYAGLKLTEQSDSSTEKRMFTVSIQDNINPSQMSIFRSWCGN